MSRSRPEYIANRIRSGCYVRVHDTTLRDGEQSAGGSMNITQKLAIAHNLAKLGVDVIEAGFPAASNQDFDAVKLIAQQVGNLIDDEDGYIPVICGFGRCTRTDIHAVWEAVKYAKRPRLLTFIATSDIHIKHKLNKTREQVLEIVHQMITYATKLGFLDIMFGAEDAARSEKEFLYRVVEVAIKAGATTVGFGDTVGYMFPNEWSEFMADMKANISGIENVIISTHCHNDLGLATANTLAAVPAGARQVEVTINGIGERAGNASLEEVVMAIKCRGQHILGGLYTGINTKYIVATSKMVEEYSGLSVQPNKAIVGANAFAHASGIHQDGVLKHKNMYEIISPDDIGLSRSNANGIVLGKLSGRSGLKFRLAELGYELEEKQLEEAFVRFKSLAENKKNLSDSDLVSLLSDETLGQSVATWKLGDMQVSSGTTSIGVSTATVKLIDGDGVEHIGCAVGGGPVTAAFSAIHVIVNLKLTVAEYSATTVNEDQITSTRVLLRNDHTQPPALTTGCGAAADVTVSSVQAYLNALNKMLL